MPYEIKSVLNKADLIGTTDTPALVVGTWYDLGEYTIPAGEVLYVGDGYWYADIKDDTADAVVEAGTIRLVAVDPEEGQLVELARAHTSEMGSANDKTKKPRLPRSRLGVKTDSKIKLQYTPDVAADIVDVSSCDIQVDVTIRVTR